MSVKLYNHIFVQLHSTGSDNHSSSSGDGWDDLSGDQFDFVSWCFLDLVISSPEIGDSGHEVNMTIGIIIFLELNQIDFKVWLGLDSTQFFNLKLS